MSNDAASTGPDFNCQGQLHYSEQSEFNARRCGCVQRKRQPLPKDSRLRPLLGHSHQVSLPCRTHRSKQCPDAALRVSRCLTCAVMALTISDDSHVLLTTLKGKGIRQ